MSRSARVDGVFGDGIHAFRLRIGELEELQEKTDAGPEEVFYRILNGGWRVADLRETLRLGLIGAGMPSTEALVLVHRYASEGALGQWKPLCISIIGAAINGAPDEDKSPGEPKGRTNRSRGAKSGSASSTKSAGPSASRPKRSPRPASGG